MEKRFMSVKELAEYLGVKVSTIYSWIAMRKIEYHKIGRLPKFDNQYIKQWVLEHKIAPAE